MDALAGAGDDAVDRVDLAAAVFAGRFDQRRSEGR
jgi:hypothetical protein